MSVKETNRMIGKLPQRTACDLKKCFSERDRIARSPTGSDTAVVRHDAERWNVRYNRYDSTRQCLGEGEAAPFVVATQHEVVGAVIKVLELGVSDRTQQNHRAR